MNVREYYEKLFHDFSDLLEEDSGVSDANTVGDILAEMPLDSTCGEDCRDAIRAAWAMTHQVQQAFGKDKPDHLINILRAAIDTCCCFIRG